MGSHKSNRKKKDVIHEADWKTSNVTDDKVPTLVVWFMEDSVKEVRTNADQGVAEAVVICPYYNVRFLCRPSDVGLVPTVRAQICGFHKY